VAFPRRIIGLSKIAIVAEPNLASFASSEHHLPPIGPRKFSSFRVNTDVRVATSEGIVTRYPIFMQGSAGDLYAYHRISKGCTGTVLLVQPFAEEMNKSRRMFSLLGEALLNVGVSSLLLDPFGTGDSGGDFEDARWEMWRLDLSVGADYLAHLGAPVTAVVALRTGALLAADWLAANVADGEPPAKIVFWQPVLKGEAWLNQFLRQRAMAAKFAGGNESVKDLRSRLAAGKSLEVGGYTLSPQWAEALGRQNLTTYLPSAKSAVAVLEVGRSGDQEGPAARAIRADWPHLSVDAAVVAGDAFWASLEITEVSALTQATVAFLSGAEQ
jgi:exosortase A-associated hydrolase 2